MIISWNFKGQKFEVFFHDHDNDIAKNVEEEMKKLMEVQPEVITAHRHSDPKPAKKQRLVSVAFKIYDYVVDDDVKEGDYVTVMSGGKPVLLEVLKVHDRWQDGINYIPVEEVIHK